MSKPYSLLLVSLGLPKDPSEINHSLGMNAWGLWHEFSKLPHVTLAFQHSEHDITAGHTDFSLLHCLFDAPVYVKNLGIVRALTRKRIINCMEISRSGKEVDKNFCFRNSLDWHLTGHAPVTHAPCPYISALFKPCNPVKDSILLDHSWEHIPNYPIWCERLYEWLEPMKDLIKVGQITHGGIDNLAPSWVEQIPTLGYTDYMEATSKYANYIVTHPESYGHSVVDMAARNIRVLVPMGDERPFSPMTDELELETFKTKEELFAILNSPRDGIDRLSRMTDMSKLVAMIDEYCQKNLD